MTEDQESKDLQSIFANQQAQDWMDEHLDELEKTASGQRLLYQSMLIGFVVGLAAQIGGYLLLSSYPKEPLGLFADLLHAFGWSLWTGIVVALFIQVIPQVKQRQIRQALEAYKALQRDQAHADIDRKGAITESEHSEEPDRAGTINDTASSTENVDKPG